MGVEGGALNTNSGSPAMDDEVKEDHQKGEKGGMEK